MLPRAMPEIDVPPEQIGAVDDLVDAADQPLAPREQVARLREWALSSSLPSIGVAATSRLPCPCRLVLALGQRAIVAGDKRRHGSGRPRGEEARAGSDA